MTQLAQGQIYNPALGTQLRRIVLGTSPGATFLDLILPNLITIGIIIGALYFIFEFILGAVKWISSEGDKQKLQEARDQLKNAFIGLVILFSLWAILKLLNAVFGIDLLLINLSPLFL